MIWTVPNILTMLRILLIPFLVVAFYVPFPHHHGVSATLFLLAALTDWLDGFLARYFQQTTKLGAFLDPVADKLMVATALGLLIALYPYPWVALPAIIIICREIIVSALREWMAEIGQRSVVKVSFVGKVKTAAQMAAIFILLLKPKDLGNIWVILGFVLLYIAVILTVYSMWLYLSAAYKAIKASGAIKD
ncbi:MULTISPECIES: CDP-diacylglycerol--glycerol-3-phosphate 3-phosphatidyltransferase [Cysteiniphilum]|uniref:CDP-diacylglycerol--glycerol-3-phosphate 3-phosphatidyltransferase n=1 Tax=Cysteiniphilum litorale TaxID=2056700 RepID=A0A8J2Z5J9_9GAMM|nr:MULTISPECIES: CDP-diacylglycerol--glycerol-3-phosphate 3-phosphatidyltransferase [Cysteiniphilum]MDA0910387.1 CDP-diacylglycerol--glycerol-3-phosphate 3-phosphatidyltransferase [Pseudomonadota bacterium]GGG02556.1 CDP-diacylglycerol--glycerol-3-phosphate 3-phosphatidyltransferase [Cysteiniphilum litorale]